MPKVKIKSTPKLKPMYKQDPTTYALDTGAPSFYDDGKDDSMSYRTTLPEVPEEEATIEAELGERVITPGFENFAVGGRKHYKGGTPLDVEPGSFVFSDHKSMRIKGDVLKEFGIDPESKLGKKGYTPADIAKRYPTNKVLAILRDKNSDKLDKESAELNLSSMKRKLAKLAFIQESMKGFDGGIPEIVTQELSSNQMGMMDNDMMSEDDMMSGNEGMEMRYGGLVKYQQGGDKKRGTRRRPKGKGYEYDPNAIDENGDPGAWVRSSSKSPAPSPQPQPSPGDIDQELPDGVLRGTQRAPKGQVSPDGSIKTGSGKIWYYVNDAYNFNDVPGKPTGAYVSWDDLVRAGRAKDIQGVTVTAKKKGSSNNKGVPPLAMRDSASILSEYQNYLDQFEPGSNTIPPSPNQETYSNKVFDTGYGSIDFMNMLSPFAIGLRKRMPTRVRVNPQQLQFNPIDLEAQRQTIQGQGRTAYAANNIISPNSSSAAARNSQILGQLLDPINQSFMTEFNANQASRAQIDSGNAQMRAQADQFNAAADESYKTKVDTVNETFDAERRLRLKSFMNALNSAEKTRQIRNAGNLVNQDYMVTAEGQIIEKPGANNPARRWARMMGMSMGSSGQSGGVDNAFSSWKNNFVPSELNLSDEAKMNYFSKWMNAYYTGNDAFGNRVQTYNPSLLANPPASGQE